MAIADFGQNKEIRCVTEGPFVPLLADSTYIMADSGNYWKLLYGFWVWIVFTFDGHIRGYCWRHPKQVCQMLFGMDFISLYIYVSLGWRWHGFLWFDFLSTHLIILLCSLWWNNVYFSTSHKGWYLEFYLERLYNCTWLCGCMLPFLLLFDGWTARIKKWDTFRNQVMSLEHSFMFLNCFCSAKLILMLYC